MAQKVSDIPLDRLTTPRKSTVESRRQHSICVRNAYKHYGRKSNSIQILENLSMTVPRGCIYGLLGASGSGKTTLINCIMGSKQLNSGEIWVLGNHPHTTGDELRIGYMPQDLCLLDDFTICETMKYFGWIASMSTENIDERLQFLVKLLDLPEPDQLVKTLSGGQKRRVSFAVALLHEPELLILDEPTVGLDSLLREAIWNYLKELTQEQVTVLLTTHYIDETKDADYIGLMRGGYILDEESPQNLLNRCGTSSLEEAFLKLSVLQNTKRRRRSSISSEVTRQIAVPAGITNQAADMDIAYVDDIVDASDVVGEFGETTSNASVRRRVSVASISPPVPEVTPPKMSAIQNMEYWVNFKSYRLKAVLWKDTMWFLRNTEVLYTAVALPILLVSLICICIGHTPVDLSIAVVNSELGNATCEKTISCNSTQLSCFYLRYLEKRDLILIPYDSEQEAIDSVIHGKSYASLIINQNYSAAIKNRIILDNRRKWDIDHSTIDVFRDVSLRDISIFISRYTTKALQDFLGDYLESCNLNRKLASNPIKFYKPVYGSNDRDYADFILPGAILSTTFMAALSLTVLSMQTETKEGIFERSLAAGVNPIEILIGHVVCNFVIVIGQVILVLVFAFVIFDNHNYGSYVLVTFISLLTGFCGMCFGIVISIISVNEGMAFMVASGVYMELVFLSGMIWPLEGMNYIMKEISNLSPTTELCIGLRNILEKGWDLSEPIVSEALVPIIVWIILSLIASVVFLKIKLWY